MPPCSASAERGFSAAELAGLFAGEVVGDPARRGYGLAPLYRAGARDISFALTERHLGILDDSGAGIVLVRRGIVSGDRLESPRRSHVLVSNPHAAFARLTSLLYERRRFVAGVEPGAHIHPDARVDASARICAGATIGAGSQIGPGVYVGAGVFIGEAVAIGPGGYLYAGCALMDGARVGCAVIIHPGAVIGADGFGFAADDGKWVKVEQLGVVIIGDEVEIGANSTIDRGALDDTVIGDGVKIDNLVHIAHNVRIGEHTAIAGCVGIAGSARIGKHCAIGGGAGILGHLEIADHVTIHAMTLVTRSIREAGEYASGIPHQPARAWNQSLASLRRLGRKRP
ncbi:UDP-3-O-(3-hydroxymyristoyl)glucosamine N-acyltransferase [Thioalkalivibrio sp.]|uniref:UDP-3-O-(3-hydroxymyristoyl)glucosamine N-acyltransferase n=1 Tax=Thioalkalivibrio sp. TaxID=2093813 RepID=UPI0039770E5E